MSNLYRKTVKASDLINFGILGSRFPRVIWVQNHIMANWLIVNNRINILTLQGLFSLMCLLYSILNHCGSLSFPQRKHEYMRIWTLNFNVRIKDGMHLPLNATLKYIIVDYIVIKWCQLSVNYNWSVLI